MNRTALVRLVLTAALSSAACVTWAQQALEIIPLRHRTVEQVLPALQPLLEPGAKLSGSRGQLFLRASAANVAEIRRALDAMRLGEWVDIGATTSSRIWVKVDEVPN